MLLRTIYDEKLAQAAYLIGCQRTGEALLVDPQRDVDRYIDLAKREGLKITAVTETHIHADFLSGTREMAERTGAKVYLSGEGGADWSYGWVNKKTGGGAYDHRLLKNNDTFNVGQIELNALHTPGHTPEHLAFQITDRGGGANEPMGLVSGDFVFVGDLGRPDLLETAAGVRGMADASAHTLFASVKQFSKLADFMQVWPGHGAGSACGKALGAVPQSTVGYENRFNPAIRAAESEQDFVHYILAGQPEPPVYFARMKKENRDGPAVLGSLPKPKPLSEGVLRELDGRRCAIIDTRTWKSFCAGHLAGSLYIPLDKMFPTVAGSFVRPEDDIFLIVEESRVDEAVRDLAHVGLDHVKGFAAPALLDTLRASGAKLSTAADIDVAGAKTQTAASGVFRLDVRSAGEFHDGHMPGATNIAYTRLAANLEKLPKDKPILVNCKSGGRSSRACSFLERAGFNVTNLAGGFDGWAKEGAPVEK